MHVPANIPSVFISESIEVLAQQFFVNQFARSFTKVLHCFPFDTVIKYLSVSAGFAVCILFPPDNLSTFIALYVVFTFLVTTTPSFHIVSKNFLETELEDLNDKEILPLFITYRQQLSLVTFFTPAELGKTGTQLLYLKSDRGTQLVL